MANAYPDRFHELIARRLIAWGLDVPPDLQERWRALRRAMLKLRPSWVWGVVKTLIGGWTTSGRFRHVSPNPQQCLFRCEGAIDQFSHYLCCDRLWWLVKDVRAVPSTSPLVRLGLGAIEDHNSPDDRRADVLKRIVIAFSTYHILKEERVPVDLAAALSLHSRCLAAARQRLNL